MATTRPRRPGRVVDEIPAQVLLGPARRVQKRITSVRGRSIELKDLSVLHWTDSADTMVVTFGEVATGERTGPVKRQYWVRQGLQWKIFFEGVIG